MRFRAETHRIEEIIVDAPVEDVDWFVALRGPHGDAAVNDPQVMPFDQFCPHLVGKEGMLEICAVINARRQHRDHRPPVASLRCAGLQRAAQILGIAADFADADCAEQFGEHVHHRLAVFEHVGHARWCAGIVLKHVEFVLAGADKIDADDVGVDPARRSEADHCRQESAVFGNQSLGHTAGADDFLPMIDVVEEGVDRAHPLFDTAREPRPFLCADDAGHNVEGNQSLFSLVRAIDVEGDSGAAKHRIGLICLFAQGCKLLAFKPCSIV